MAFNCHFWDLPLALCLCEHIEAPISKLYIVVTVSSGKRVRQVVRRWGHQAGNSLQAYRRGATPRDTGLNRYGPWFLTAWLAALANGKLLVAIAAGALVYRSLSRGYQLPWKSWAIAANQFGTQVLRIGQTPLGASLLAFLGTYVVAVAWSDFGGQWVTIGFLGLGAVNGVPLFRRLIGETIHPEIFPAPPSEDFLTAHWHNLTAQAPVKRLLAVRQLLKWCLSSPNGGAAYLPGTTVTQRSHLIDCFRLMLVHEAEPIVRVALIDGLKALQPKPQLSPGQPAVEPLISQPAPLAVERSVEYIEP